MLLAQTLTLWSALALGQTPAPAESACLKAVPAEAEIVVRVRGVESARADLIKMLEAMSPNLATLAGPPLEQAATHFAGRFGAVASRSPFIALLRLESLAGAAGGQLPFAILMPATDYAAVQKSAASVDAPKPVSKGAYDEIEGAEGKMYTYKGDGFIAFGTDEALIKAVAGKSPSALNADVAAGLLTGDIGLFVKLSAIQARYGEQIEGARTQLLQAMDQAAGGNAGMMKMFKSVYGGMFDALKMGDGLALSLDFAADGLTVASLATVKPDTAASRALGAGRAGTGEMIARLPADATTFMYLNVPPELMATMQKMTMSMLVGDEKPSPEMAKATELTRAAGIAETVAAGGLAGGPSSRTLNLSLAADPAKAAEATSATMAAMKGGKGPLNFIKDMKIEPKAESYKGFTLDKATVTYDLEKMAQLQPNNPGGAQGIKAMLGGETITTWYGTDGKQVLSVAAAEWDQAKAQIDAVVGGQGSLGTLPAYKALRARLPEKAGVYFVMSAQGLVCQAAAQIGAMLPNGAGLKVPAGMPKAVALLGASLATTPVGYRFQLVVPSAVGPVLENGMVPLFQGLQGRADK